MRKRVAVGMLVRAGEVLTIKRGATPTIFSINFDVVAEGSTTERLHAQLPSLLRKFWRTLRPSDSSP